MGIDIYLHWEGQTEEEKKAQFTGFSVVAGGVGYLREAYHGGPYVTKFLLEEAYETGEARIPAATMRERLPAAVLLSIHRENKVYGKADIPEEFTSDVEKDGMVKLMSAMTRIFGTEMRDASHATIAAAFTPESLAYAKQLIDSRTLPDYALTFVEFVELAERREELTGEACMINFSG